MIKIKVDDVEMLFTSDWSVSIKNNTRSTFEGRLYYTDQDFNFGDELKVYDNDDTCIFAGIIKKFTKIATDETNQVLYLDVSAVDYTILTEKRVIAQVIENMKATDVITSYIMPILAEEGITSGLIDGDFTISRDVWRYFRISECLDRLAELQVGYIWYIDVDKKLHFYNKSNGTIIYMNDQSNVYNISQSRSMETYRNTQYVLTPDLRTGEQELEILSPRADGTTRTFLTRFPIAEKPTLWYTNDVTAGTPTWNLISDSDIGINGVDEGKKWYWSYNSQTVTQDDGESVLPNNGAMRATYIGFRKGVIKLKNDSQIDDRKTKEQGTSGIYEHVLELQDIDDFYQAVKYCRNVLTSYINIADSLEFDTQDTSYIRGNTISMLSDFYLVDNATFFITNVHITQESPTRLNISVTAHDSVIITDWEKFFFDLIKNQKKVILNVDDILTSITAIEETMYLNGNYFVWKFTGESIPLTIPFYLGSRVNWM